MNTFEKCCLIRRMIVNQAAEVMAYDNWGSEFAVKQIRNFPSEIRKMKSGKDLFEIQPAEMTKIQLKELGFSRWDSKTEMRLIPLYLFPFLAEEIKVECIDGTSLTKKSDMDKDIRFGCLAYGVIPVDA